VNELAQDGVKLNITALTTLDQVENVVQNLNSEVPSYVSVFAGRIADTGVDPLPIMRRSVEILAGNVQAELIWASPRELLNIIQAAEVGCHIITVTPSIMKKLELVGYDLEQYSLDTVKMFRADAVAAGYSL
jgi:transaldolase